MRSENHKDKDSKHAEKTKDKDKTTGTTTTANGTPAAGSKPVPGAPASGATPGPTAINTIHPIPSPPPAAVTGSGKGIVTVSDGKGNSVIIPDHGTGVTVTSDGPGHVTISNGVESRTVSGIALTISGASAVAVAKGLGTGPRQADGSTVVLSPNGTVTGGPDPNALGGLGGFLTGGGFEAHAPAP